jgi:hypothetical protein
MHQEVLLQRTTNVNLLPCNNLDNQRQVPPWRRIGCGYPSQPPKETDAFFGTMRLLRRLWTHVRVRRPRPGGTFNVQRRARTRLAEWCHHRGSPSCGKDRRGILAGGRVWRNFQGRGKSLPGKSTTWSSSSATAEAPFDLCRVEYHRGRAKRLEREIREWKIKPINTIKLPAMDEIRQLGRAAMRDMAAGSCKFAGVMRKLID